MSGPEHASESLGSTEPKDVSRTLVHATFEITCCECGWSTLKTDMGWDGKIEFSVTHECPDGVPVERL